MHRSCVAALLTLLVILSAPRAGAEIFRWKDAQGVVHYSDRAEQGVEAETVQLRPDPRPPEPDNTEVLSPGPAGEDAPPQPDRMKVRTSRPNKTATTTQPDDVSVVMYVAPKCVYCDRARKYFIHRGVPWSEIDITASTTAARDFKAKGGTGTPLVLINGSRIHGYNPASYDLVFERLGYR